MQIVKVANIIINLIKPSMQRPEWFARKTSLFAHFQIKFENFSFCLFLSSPQKLFNFRGQLCTLNHANCFKVAKIIINLIKPSMQRCPSGLRCSPGKAVCEKSHRGFESLFLRQKIQTEKVCFFINQDMQGFERAE